LKKLVNKEGERNMGKKYYITIAVLTTFLLLATIGSVAQQQDYIAIKIEILSDNSAIIAEKAKNADIELVTFSVGSSSFGLDSAEAQEAEMIPTCDCGGCPGGPVFVNGEWHCVCAPCIPEDEDTNVDGPEIQAEEDNYEQIINQFFTILTIGLNLAGLR